MSEMELIQTSLAEAKTFEDVFGLFAGTRPGDLLKELRKTFARLSRAVHPDLHPGEKSAEDAFAALNAMYRGACLVAEAGDWGKKKTIPGRETVMLAGKYELVRLLSVGDIADVHAARMRVDSREVPVAIKAARMPADGDLLVAEQKNLAAFRKRLTEKNSVWLECVPEVIDSFLIGEGMATRRRVNVVEAFPGFVTGQQILQAMPGGVDGRTAVWMWKRMLLLLDWTYRCGLIHGAVLPPHVMFYPDNDGATTRDRRKHAIRLIDWCYSIRPAERTRLSSWMPAWKDFYAPEILAKKTLGPSTDLYMAAKTMVYLTGGDARSGLPGKHIPDPLAQSFAACMHERPEDRPGSAGDHFKAFLEVQKKVYGEPTWHDLNVPGCPARFF